MSAIALIAQRFSFEMRNFFCFILIGATLCLVFWALERVRPLQVSFVIYAEHATKAQIFFDTGSGFVEAKKKEFSISPKTENTITCTLPSRTDHVRIDPATSVDTINIRSLTLKRTNDDETQLIPSDCVETNQDVHVVSQSDYEMQLRTVGADPQLLISKRCIPSQQSSIAFKRFLPGILALSCVGLLLLVKARRDRHYGILLVQAIVLCIVLIQVLSIVNLSEYNSHPDETGHVLASKFYQENWFKKQADSQEMLHSLIPSWGFSYLYLSDVVYFLAEKTTSFLSFLSLEDYKRYRLFNFLLLCILFLTFFSDRKDGHLFLATMGLSPQIWYLFSYFNGDGFSLFVSLLLCFTFVKKQNKLLDYFWKNGRINITVMLYTAMCSLVLMTRLQYTVVVVFNIALLLLQKPSDRKWRPIMPVLRRVCLLVIAILMVIGLFELKEQQANSFKKAEIVASVEEKNVIVELSKTNILETGNNPYNLYLRDLGVPLTDLLIIHPWLKDSITSLLGVYGYFSFTSSTFFYWICGLSGFGMVILGFCILIFNATGKVRGVIILVFFGILFVFFQSLMLSWMVGFQPQGRYLMAAVPIIATGFCLVHERLPKRRVQGWMLTIYLINCLGFGIFGLIPLLNI